MLSGEPEAAKELASNNAGEASGDNPMSEFTPVLVELGVACDRNGEM